MDNLTIALFLITYFGITFIIPVIMFAIAIISLVELVCSRIAK